MNTTSLHIKIESDIKEQAQKTAGELGLSLSAVTKALLKQFIRTKRLSIGANERPEIPNEYLKKILEESEQESKAGRNISFKNSKDARSYIDSLIEHDNQSTR